MSSGKGVVLMYHRLGEGVVEGREEGEAAYAVPRERFREQLDVLEESRCEVLPLARLCAAGDVPARAVAITFDDGNASDATEALPELRRHGFHATFFVTPGRVGAPGYLDWGQVRALEAAGMAVGAHGWDHADLSLLPDEEVRAQLARSRDALAAHLQSPPDAMSLPHGGGGARVVRLAREAGFLWVADSRPRRARPGSGAPAVPRYAVRRGDSRAAFRALVEQRPLALGWAMARHAGVRRLRAVLGDSAYRAVRRAWVERAAS